MYEGRLPLANGGYRQTTAEWQRGARGDVVAR
jgi:hypothetical protein